MKYEEIRKDVIDKIRNLGFLGYSTEDLRFFVDIMEVMCRDLEEAAKEITSVEDAFAQAAEKDLTYFKPSETESD